MELSPALNVVKAEKGPVMTTLDEFYKVGPGAFEFAYDRPDAHHLRFLSALHKATGGPTRQGDGTQGPPVRQSQRDWQRPRHGARFARGTGRKGARDCRSRVSRQYARQARSDVPRQARLKNIKSHSEGHCLTTPPRATFHTRTR